MVSQLPFVFQVVDKAEYRTYAAQSLVQLLSKLPSESYATFIAWLYKYSRSSKVGDGLYKSLGPGSEHQVTARSECRRDLCFGSYYCWWNPLILPWQIPHRVFTLDVALALLELPEREADDTVSLEHQKFLKHKFFVQEIIFDRCLDKAPTVRSKALSSFAHCLELTSGSTSESILEIFINSE